MDTERKEYAVVGAIPGSLFVGRATVRGDAIWVGHFYRHDNSPAPGIVEFQGADLGDVLQRVTRWADASDISAVAAP